MTVEQLVSLEVDQGTGEIKVDPATGGLQVLNGLGALEQAVLLAVREHPAAIMLVNARPDRFYSLLSTIEDDLEEMFEDIKVGGLKIGYQAGELSLSAEVIGSDSRSISLVLTLLET